MKSVYALWIIVLLTLMQPGCKEKTTYVHLLATDSDSLYAARIDSVMSNDPWYYFSYEQRQGKRLYEQYCSICHGDHGEGDGFNAYNLDPRPHSMADSSYMKSLSDESLIDIITYGGGYVNKSVLMPAYQNTFGKKEIAYLMTYIRTFTTN